MTVSSKLLPFFRISLFAAALLFITILVQNARAADTDLVLMEGPHARITQADIEADALQIPEDVRNRALSNPEQVRNLTETLYVRRSLAVLARQQRHGESSLDKARLQLAEDAALSELYLTALKAQLERDDALLEKLARNEYNANRERFKGPTEKRASHILVTGEKAKEKIQNIHRLLREGGDFGKLAEQHSQDSANAGKGGDLGFFAPGRMVPEFDAAIAELKQGEYSLPFETQFGWHVAKLTGQRAAGQRSFEEVRKTLKEEAQNRVFRQRRTELLQALKGEGTVHADALERLVREFQERVAK